MKTHLARHLLVALLGVAITSILHAQTTAFTYQGRLDEGGAAAHGIYDLQFRIYDAPANGNQVGGFVNAEDVPVANGLFAVTLDFGTGVFTGGGRWLEIGVRQGNISGNYTSLTPRQSITATPYAIRAASAMTVDAGTLSNPSFFGTTVNQPLEVKVNNVRALRIEPHPTSSNVIGGHPSNSVSPGIYGAVIGGGGEATLPNSVEGNFATVAGGSRNIAVGAYSLASGLYSVSLGYCSTAIGWRCTSRGDYSTAMGRGTANGDYSTALGLAIANGNYSIAAGSDSTAGGLYSTAMGFQTAATGEGSVALGYQTTASGYYSTALGLSTIASGDDSTAMGWESVASGHHSVAMCGATASGEYSVAMGRATASGDFSTAMGDQTTASNYAALAAGHRAQAIHAGSFVWGDFSSPSYFASTGSNQFLVRATGGVGIGETSPEAPLHVSEGSAGTVTTRADSVAVFEKAGDAYVSLVTPTVNESGILFANPTNSADGGIVYNSSTPRGLDFRTGGNTTRMVVTSAGNIGMGTSSPTQRLHVMGNILASGTVTGSSDRNIKENFESVDAQEVLDRISALPIRRWNYIGEDVTHIGPVAQDFHAAFQVGMDDKHISMVDADGVALAAIQALNKRLEQREAELAVLRQELKEIKQLLSNNPHFPALRPGPMALSDPLPWAWRVR